MYITPLTIAIVVALFLFYSINRQRSLRIRRRREELDEKLDELRVVLRNRKVHTIEDLPKGTDD